MCFLCKNILVQNNSLFQFEDFRLFLYFYKGCFLYNSVFNFVFEKIGKKAFVLMSFLPVSHFFFFLKVKK